MNFFPCFFTAGHPVEADVLRPPLFRSFCQHLPEFGRITITKLVYDGLMILLGDAVEPHGRRDLVGPVVLQPLEERRNVDVLVVSHNYLPVGMSLAQSLGSCDTPLG